MMEQNATISLPVYKVTEDGTDRQDDVLAVEEPLEISLSAGAVTRTVSITMRTPGHDEALATGFLFTEGIVRGREEVLSVGHTGFDLNRVMVTLAPGFNPDLQQADRNFYTTSSCGVCGKTSIDAIRTVSSYHGLADALAVSRDLLFRLPDQLRQQQEVFNSTGGLHACALFDVNGGLRALCEDVGRHNALDKLVGACLMRGDLPLAAHVLLLSGRASFELLQKAAMAGIKLVAAVGAPSSLAVQLAADSGITLVGFLRGRRFNVYTHPHRVI